jgi:hypothetical protein
MTMGKSSAKPYSVASDDSTGCNVDEVVIKFVVGVHRYSYGKIATGDLA